VGAPGVTLEQFWALVEQTLRDAQALPTARRGLLRRPVALRPGQRHVLALQRRLDASPPAELLAVQTHLDALRAGARRRGLWRAGQLVLGSMDVDVFTDLRTWLVSQGRAAYERVVAEPGAFALLAPPDLRERVGDAEAWGYVALDLWDAQRPDEMPRPAAETGGGPDDLPP
jgi:Protein of unknown function (DUF4240)